jgi:hypothetical protein
MELMAADLPDLHPQQDSSNGSSSAWDPQYRNNKDGSLSSADSFCTADFDIDVVCYTELDGE